MRQGRCYETQCWYQKGMIVIYKLKTVINKEIYGEAPLSNEVGVGAGGEVSAGCSDSI